ncbi:MAG: hypothetical protein KC505_09145 [Myxococcales bacterium]|nr:hypothetical protein [Myxococcales bacterium]USN51640.1 MAG: hypothetical protein H6731_04310 [Myxococcales bacterium]
MKLFDRVIELSVGNTDISGLDIVFEIEKDLNPEPNPCHIEIYNLSAKNRQVLSKAGKAPVILKAGYKDKVGVIFHGDMTSLRHEKDGPTWKTFLATGDGALAIQTARINKSFTKGTRVKDVIKEIAKQLKLPCDSALKQLEGIGETLARGFSLSGCAMDELIRMLGQHGLSASIQNQALQIIKHEGFLLGKAISLTANSGLKASPGIGSDKTLCIRAVLMPELLPGTQVHVESQTFTGFATIQKVRFSGSNFGEEWETEIFGKTN